MARSREFCPRCGRDLAPAEGFPAPDDRAAGDAVLCRSCFLESIDLVSVPEELTIPLCANCGAIRRNGNWEDIETEDYTEVAISTLGEHVRVHRAAADVEWVVDPIQRGPNELDLRVTVSARIDGQPIEDRRHVAVRLKRETCRRCGRIAGDYYAGTVQVRAAGRTPTTDEMDRSVEIAHDVVDGMRETGNREAFVGAVLERPEGVDIRVSTNRLGGQIATRITDEFGGHVEASETLVTEDADGVEVYRVAYAVRLPRFRPGDVVDPSDDDGPVLVRSVSDAVRGRRLATGEEATLEAGAIAEATHLGTAADAVETTLVTVEDANAIQVLDPETQESITIPRPPGFDPVGDAVSVVKTRDGVFVIPREWEQHP